MKRILVLILCLSSSLWAETYNVSLITMDSVNAHWKSVYVGALNARNDLRKQNVDIKLTWSYGANPADIKGQIAAINSNIKDKVSGIIISPSDAVQLAQPLAAAVAAKIPVIIIDSGLKEGPQISFVRTDNKKGGALAAQRIGTLLNGKGKVALFRSQKGKDSTDQREAGFCERLKEQFPDIQLISDDVYAGADLDEAKKAARGLIKAHGHEIEAIFAPNQTTASAMLFVLREAKLNAGKIKLIGFDSYPEAVDAIKLNDMQGSVAQNPVRMGSQGLLTLVKHLKGEPVDAEIDTGCLMLTNENINDNLMNPSRPGLR